MMATSIDWFSKNGPVVAAAEQALAGGDRNHGALADVAQRRRDRECRSRPRRGRTAPWRAPLEEALGLVVEVEVDQDVDVRPGALAEGGELIADRVDNLAVGVELGEALAARRSPARAGTASSPSRRTLVLSAVQPRPRLPCPGARVVQGAQRRDPHLLRTTAADTSRSATSRGGCGRAAGRRTARRPARPAPWP